MKKPLLILSFLLMTKSIFAGCNQDYIVIERSTSFGLSFGMGGSSSNANNESSINLPITINGKRGCVKQESAIQMNVEIKDTKGKSEFELFSPKVDVEGTSKVQVNTFVKFEGISEKSLLQEDIFDALKVSVISYTCVGSKLVLGRSFEGNMQKILNMNEATMSYRSTIATGAAARNITQKYKEKGYSNIIPSFFSQFIDDNFSPAWESELVKVQVPNILMTTQLSSPLISYDSVHVSNILMEYGCHPEFSKKLSPYLLKNVKEQLKNFPGKVKVTKKKGREVLQLKW